MNKLIRRPFGVLRGSIVFESMSSSTSSPCLLRRSICLEVLVIVIKIFIVFFVVVIEILLWFQVDVASTRNAFRHTLARWMKYCVRFWSCWARSLKYSVKVAPSTFPRYFQTSHGSGLSGRAWSNWAAYCRAGAMLLLLCWRCLCRLKPSTQIDDGCLWNTTFGPTQTLRCREVQEPPVLSPDGWCYRPRPLHTHLG